MHVAYQRNTSLHFDGSFGQNKIALAINLHATKQLRTETTHRLSEIGHIESKGDPMHPSTERALKMKLSTRQTKYTAQLQMPKQLDTQAFS